MEFGKLKLDDSRKLSGFKFCGAVKNTQIKKEEQSELLSDLWQWMVEMDCLAGHGHPDVNQGHAAFRASDTQLRLHFNIPEQCMTPDTVQRGCRKVGLDEAESNLV